MSSRPSRGAARLAAILDALPDALLLVNCNGTIVNANTIALETFETPGTALVGRGLLDLLPSFDPNRIPGSMRRPADHGEGGRTKPTRMIARRTDGSEFPVEVTSANLEDGRTPYADPYEHHYTGDELLMLVVRDLTGTVDTEAELARQQRQTEMILRAAAEGVIGVDTEGRVVLVNPSAAQILGYRASDLGGQELHPLIHHSRPDGSPLPYEETPLADTLRSGRKHRVRGQVLWAKDGSPVAVDMTTAPVRDGDQLVGAVMTFTDRRKYDEMVARHTQQYDEMLAEQTERYDTMVAEQTERYDTMLAEQTERYDAMVAQKDEQYDALAARHAQLAAVLGHSLRGPLEQLRTELGTLASDPAGQLWPEANQILHYLTAGYARMTTLVDSVLGYQRLDTGEERLRQEKVSLDTVVAAGVEAAVELIGPGRAQFAVHAPPIEAEVDAMRLAQALSHLIADVAGVDATGNTAAGMVGSGDSTIVVAAAQRGEVVRLEVRGPYAGGDPVHQPIVRGIVRLHGGVLQTHEVPGAGGSAYVLEVPIAAAAPSAGQRPGVSLDKGTGRKSPAGQEPGAAQAEGTQGGQGTDGQGADGQGPTNGAGRSIGSTSGAVPVPPEASPEPTGRRRARRDPEAPEGATTTAQGGGLPAADAAQGPAERTPAQPTGRRRGRPSLVEAGEAVPEGIGSAEAAGPEVPAPGPGRRARRNSSEQSPGTPAAAPEESVDGDGPAAGSPVPADAGAAAVPAQGTDADAYAPAGRRARRAAGPEQAPAHPNEPGGQAGRALPALPAAAADAGRQAAWPTPGQGPGGLTPVQPQTASAQGLPGAAPAPRPPQQMPPQQPPVLAPVQSGDRPTGRRARRALAEAAERPVPEQARQAFALPPAAADQAQAAPARTQQSGAWPGDDQGRHDPAASGPEPDHTPAQAHPVPTGRRRARRDPAEEQQATASGGLAPEGADPAGAGGGGSQGAGVPTPPAAPAGTPPQGQAPAPGQQRPGPLPYGPPAMPPQAPTAEAQGADPQQGRAISVRTLGQGVPFAQQIADQQRTPPPFPVPMPAQAPAGSGRRRKLAAPPQDAERGARPAAGPAPAARPPAKPQAAPPPQPQPRLLDSQGEGRAYAIGAPDEGAEGPEPLDGPNGAIDVTDAQAAPPRDDELPPEPLDNPRRLLVWPAPDVATQQALSDRGYRPVIVNSREEVDAQIAAYPAALFVDPLTGPITRTALQSLRTAAMAAEVPVLVTAGLGQATREAAYGADPAVLLKALAPRDSEQHPPRVLLIEEQDAIAGALSETLQRRGMQVARATSDADAATLAAQMRPNLVVMDLMQVRRRRAGIIDWLRSNGLLTRTPIVVYTSADIDPAELPRLSSGETVLFLAERSTSAEVQSRIVDLLAKIGAS